MAQQHFSVFGPGITLRCDFHVFFLSRGDEMTNSKKKVYDNELRAALSITVEYSFRKKLSSGALV